MFALHPIDVELQSLPESAKPEERLEVIWRHYTEATGMVLDAPPSKSQRQAVFEWLKSLRAGPRDDDPGLLVKRPRLVLAAALSPREKAGSMAQFSCGSCEPVPDANGNLGRIFPIRVDPWSAQANSGRNIRLKRAVRGMLQAQSMGFATKDLPMCVSVTALVPRTHKVKDADNLLKGILDSLTTVIYGDDRQIQCLSSRRVEYAGAVGLYWVQVRAVQPWSADTVWDDPNPPIVLWGEPIDI